MKSLLVCAAVIMVNHSDEPFNERDRKEFNTAKKICPREYPNKPCPTVFIKIDKLTYRMLCGPKGEKNGKINQTNY